MSATSNLSTASGTSVRVGNRERDLIGRSSCEPTDTTPSVPTRHLPRGSGHPNMFLDERVFTKRGVSYANTSFHGASIDQQSPPKMSLGKALQFGLAPCTHSAATLLVVLLGHLNLLRSLRHRLLVGGAVGGDPVPRGAGAGAGPCRGADGAGKGVLAPAAVVAGGSGAGVAVRPLSAAARNRGRNGGALRAQPIPRGA